MEKLPFGVTQFYVFEREAYYIQKHNSIENGYNIAPTTASTKLELLEALKTYGKSKLMKEYILEIIRKRDTPILKRTTKNTADNNTCGEESSNGKKEE